MCCFLNNEKLWLRGAISLNKANVLLCKIWRSLEFRIADVQKQDLLGTHEL